VTTVARAATPMRRLLAAPAGAALAVAVAFTLVAMRDPHEAGSYPLCPTLHLTGLLCPGCGGLRAAHDLVHGDVAAALHQNALLVLGLPVFVALWVRWTVRRARGADALIAPFRTRTWVVLLALALAFSVVRNLPFGAVLAP
jgi:hypothetical protein